MFNEILNMVKEHLGNNPQVASTIPEGQEDQVHREVATQIHNTLNQNSGGFGGMGGMLSQLQNGLTSNNPIANAIEGGIVSSLASKFGLPPAATGAIAASLPGLLQKIGRHQTV
jgi:hypothetical protein